MTTAKTAGEALYRSMGHKAWTILRQIDQASWQESADAVIAWHEAQRTGSAEPIVSNHDAMLIANTYRVSVPVVRAIEKALGRDLAVPQPSAEPVLSDEQIDALDTFSLHWMAPRHRESVRDFARAVIAAIKERT
jgi:hypothetical protein